MNKNQYIKILQNPSEVDKEQIAFINSLIKDFPYFQSSRAIYLKVLKNSGNFKYNEELKLAAAYTTDRSILFDFITSNEFQQEKIVFNENEIKNLEVGGGTAYELVPMDSVSVPHYLRIRAEDRPGIMAKITNVLSDFNISIEAVIQKEPYSDVSHVSVVLLTEEVGESLLREAVDKIEGLSEVSEPVVDIRLESMS